MSQDQLLSAGWGVSCRGEGVKIKGDKVTASEDAGVPPGPRRQPRLLGDRGMRGDVLGACRDTECVCVPI